MLRNMHASVVGKLASSNVQEYRGSTAELLEAVLPLGFVRGSRQMTHSMCLILSKGLNPGKAREVFDAPENGVLGELTL